MGGSQPEQELGLGVVSVWAVKVWTFSKCLSATDNKINSIVSCSWWLKWMIPVMTGSLVLLPLHLLYQQVWTRFSASIYSSPTNLLVLLSVLANCHVVFLFQGKLGLPHWVNVSLNDCTYSRDNRLLRTVHDWHLSAAGSGGFHARSPCSSRTPSGF